MRYHNNVSARLYSGHSIDRPSRRTLTYVTIELYLAFAITVFMYLNQINILQMGMARAPTGVSQGFQSVCSFNRLAKIIQSWFYRGFVGILVGLFLACMSAWQTGIRTKFRFYFLFIYFLYFLLIHFYYYFFTIPGRSSTMYYTQLCVFMSNISR